MSIATIMKSVIKSTPHISVLLLNVLWVYLTLDMRVRETRRAFEKQLVEQGMTKEDAKRLSACYQDLKDNISAAVKQGITSGFSSMQR
jgi:hypothetical protein